MGRDRMMNRWWKHNNYTDISWFNMLKRSYKSCVFESSLLLFYVSWIENLNAIPSFFNTMHSSSSPLSGYIIAVSSSSAEPPPPITRGETFAGSDHVVGHVGRIFIFTWFLLSRLLYPHFCSYRCRMNRPHGESISVPGFLSNPNYDNLEFSLGGLSLTRFQ